MHTTHSPDGSQGKIDAVQDAITDFFAQFHIGSLLNQAGIRKIRGARPLDIVTVLFTLPLQRTTLYWRIIGSRTLAFRKDAAYDMLNRSNFNWRNLLLSLAVAVIHFIDPLTDKNRESVLILDDTLYKRNRSKSVVLLARVYDHLLSRIPVLMSGLVRWSQHRAHRLRASILFRSG